MIDKIFILKFIKFCVVGASGMVVDFGVTWILKEKLKVNKYIANSTGFILAATSNYV
ncbi:MAG: GtrA-like protein [Bacteroidetes bacterium ADurb.Bin057]|nr:MAG: GtrA-like protein [Bacteroidetes bacterium ADurb.Bin057]